jgi:hypothetical protein
MGTLRYFSYKAALLRLDAGVAKEGFIRGLAFDPAPPAIHIDQNFHIGIQESFPGQRHTLIVRMNPAAGQFWMRIRHQLPP